MNVIENILTTKKYRNIKAVLDMKKALLELVDYEIDMNDKNAPHEFKAHIDKTLRDIIKNIPYSLSIDKPICLNEWFQDMNPRRNPIYSTDSGHFEPRVVTTIDTGHIDGTSISVGRINGNSISDLVHRPNRGPNPYVTLTSDRLSSEALYRLSDGTISSRSNRVYQEEDNETDDK